jgi:hypothetical protein
MSVTMTCMTTKQKFEVENPEVVVLSNGRYAYRAECPWTGKNNRPLTAFKFCSTEAYKIYTDSLIEKQDEGEQEQDVAKQDTDEHKQDDEKE